MSEQPAASDPLDVPPTVSESQGTLAAEAAVPEAAQAPPGDTMAEESAPEAPEQDTPAEATQAPVTAEEDDGVPHSSKRRKRSRVAYDEEEDEGGAGGVDGINGATFGFAEFGDGDGDGDGDGADKDASTEFQSLPQTGLTARQREESLITYEDVFGDLFVSEQFRLLPQPPTEEQRVEEYEQLQKEAFRKVKELKAKVSKAEESDTFDAELDGLFGSEARDLLGLQPHESLRHAPAVHTISTLSARDGKKMNAHTKPNRYFPKGGSCQSYLTTLPVLDNYQCLHLPLSGPQDDRRLAVGEEIVPKLVNKKPIIGGQQGAGQTFPGAIYSPENVVRWRKHKRGHIESNARLLKYDNGDTVLRVGNDHFILESQEAVQENQHLMGIHSSVLLEHMKIRKRWRVRPLRRVGKYDNSTIREKSFLPSAPVKAVKPFIGAVPEEKKLEAEREQRFQQLWQMVRPHTTVQADEEEIHSEIAQDEAVALPDTDDVAAARAVQEEHADEGVVRTRRVAQDDA